MRSSISIFPPPRRGRCWTGGRATSWTRRSPKRSPGIAPTSRSRARTRKVHGKSWRPERVIPNGESRMSQRGKRVFITGGAGFIGACLARDLIDAGAEVHLALRKESKLWRLAGLEGLYEPHWADVREAGGLRQAMHACRPQVIYHLATHGAYYHQRARSDIIATNLTGTANLLDALEGHEYEALVYTGSSSEYGHKSEPMQPEDRLEPPTDYGVTKAAATLLCLAEAMKGRPVSVVRVFSAFGPWEEPGRLVPYVVECCARGEHPKVTAGLQPRDFIYVSDVVDCSRSPPRILGRPARFSTPARAGSTRC